jgi:hypothetical protein
MNGRMKVLLSIVLFGGAACRHPGSERHAQAVSRGETARTPMAWTNEPFVSEYAMDPYTPGRIELDVEAQVVHFTLREGGGESRFALAVRQALSGFRAVTFTQIDPGELVLGGYDPARRTSKLIRVHFTASGQLTTEPIDWQGPKFAVASSLGLFPDRSRVAILDHVSNRVFVYEFATKAMCEVVDANRGDGLANARHVHVKPIGGSRPGSLVIWATDADENGLVLATRMGASVRMLDQDGDGRFETIQ